VGVLARANERRGDNDTETLIVKIEKEVPLIVGEVERGKVEMTECRDIEHAMGRVRASYKR
jgi:hypothetical protein